MTQPSPRTTWQDGDPYLEAIAAAAWEHCEKQHGSGLIIDDPRNIAEAVAATARAAALREAAELGRELSRQGYSAQEIANRLDRMAEEART